MATLIWGTFPPRESLRAVASNALAPFSSAVLSRPCQK